MIEFLVLTKCNPMSISEIYKQMPFFVVNKASFSVEKVLKKIFFLIAVRIGSMTKKLQFKHILSRCSVQYLAAHPYSLLLGISKSVFHDYNNI